MTGVLTEVLIWIGGEILFWVAYFILGFLFWIVVLPVLVVVLTPMFLVASAVEKDPFGQAMRRKYKRLLDLWTDLTSLFP